MNIEEIKERINKVNSKISNLSTKVTKIKNKMNVESFIKTEAKWYSATPKSVKTMDDLSYARWYRHSGNEKLSESKEVINKSFKDFLNDAESRIKSAEKEINSQHLLLAKYNNLLEFQKQRLSKPVHGVFKDFFENWKQKIIEFSKEHLKKYLELDKANCELFNKTSAEEKRTLEFKNKYSTLVRAAQAHFTSWARDLFYKGEEEFKKYLDKYMLDRYYELVDKITAITGEFTDVKNIYIGKDGSLNGTVTGNNGTAKIETIVAGGYNIQCLHYRVLVHKVKEN